MNPIVVAGGSSRWMTAGPLRLCGRSAGRAVDDGSCGCGDGVVHGCVIAAATVWVPALLWWGAGPAVGIAASVAGLCGVWVWMLSRCGGSGGSPPSTG